MPIKARCACGRSLRARDEFAGKRARCPTCGRTVQIPGKSPEPAAAAAGSEPDWWESKPEPMPITEFLDPPDAPIETPQDEKEPVLRRMFDPNKAALRAQPRDARDLAIQANNSACVMLDNLSRV